VGRVVLTPAPKRGQFEVILHGELASILKLVFQKRESPTPRPGVRLSVVAGKRFTHTHRLPPLLITLRSSSKRSKG
jgi:hypothetical protein